MGSKEIQRHLPADFDDLSGYDKLRAANNAVVMADRLSKDLIRPLSRKEPRMNFLRWLKKLVPPTDPTLGQWYPSGGDMVCRRRDGAVERYRR